MNESLRNDNLIPEVQLREDLAERYRDTTARMDDLLQTSATWVRVETEEQASQVSDLRKGFQALIKSVDAAHAHEKAPWTGLAKVVDGFFFPQRDRLKAELQRINRYEIEFLQKKEAAERRRREEEAEKARKAAEEALRLAQEEEERANPNKPDEAALQAAIIAEEAARRAEKAALAKPADLSRVRGDLGSVSSLRKRWTGEMVDRDRLDLEALRSHLGTEALNQAIRSWVKANTGDNMAPPLLTGARVWQETFL